MTPGKKEISEIRKAIDKRYDGLLREVREALESSGRDPLELPQREPEDAGDASISDMLEDLNLDAIDRHVREMRALEAARARINDGSYGVCVDCGAEIVFERLLVQPAATRCYTCQQRRERTHAHPGAPLL